MPTPSLSGRRNSRGRMRRGNETGKEEARMERGNGKEEAKLVVAKEGLPKEAVSFVEKLTGLPSASRTASTRASLMLVHPQAKGVCLCYAQ